MVDETDVDDQRRAYYEARLRDEGLDTREVSSPSHHPWFRLSTDRGPETPEIRAWLATATRSIALEISEATPTQDNRADGWDELLRSPPLIRMPNGTVLQNASIRTRSGTINLEPTNNEEDTTMSKADRDYTLLDLKRLDISLIRRKIDRLEDLDNAQKHELCEQYAGQVDYLTKIAGSYPQILQAGYLELLELSGEPADFIPCLTDKSELNKLVMAYIEANAVPPMAASKLADTELELIAESLKERATSAIDETIKHAESNIISSNNSIRSYQLEIDVTKRRIAEEEQRLNEALIRKHKSDDSLDLKGLFATQVGLIQEKLGWGYVAYYDNAFWFRTPMQVMISREAGVQVAAPTCSYLVGLYPMVPEGERFARVLVIEGNVEGNHGCPFHSRDSWCYGSANNQARDQLASGNMFAAARTMQFLMVTYQADGPYRTFRDWKRSARPLENWTFAPHLGRSGTGSLLSVVYGNGDWREMVERALNDKVHLDGDYTTPFSPIISSSSNRDRNDLWFRRRTSTEEGSTIVTQLVESGFQNANWGIEGVDWRFYSPDDSDEYLNEDDFNIRWREGQEFRIILASENDDDSDGHWSEVDVQLEFRDGLKVSIDFTINFNEGDAYYDRSGEDTNLRSIRQVFANSLRVASSPSKPTNTTHNPDDYSCINQRRIRAFKALPREVLERGNLTEIIKLISMRGLTQFDTYRNERVLESLQLFRQPTTQETEDVSNDEL